MYHSITRNILTQKRQNGPGKCCLEYAYLYRIYYNLSNKFLYARLQTGRIMVWWCPSIRPSDSPSARFPHFSHTCFDILSWNFAHDFVLLYYRSSLSVVTLRQFLKELCLFLNLDYRKCAVFYTFSPTCFDILSWNFAYDFVLLYYRSSLSVVTLRQFLKELCLFVNLDYRKCAVFHTFLLHALTYLAEILRMTLFYCTTDQVWVSSSSVNFCRSYVHFWM